VESARLGLREYARFQEFQLRMQIDTFKTKYIDPIIAHRKEMWSTMISILGERSREWRDAARQRVQTMKWAMVENLLLQATEVIDSVAQKNGYQLVFHRCGDANKITCKYDPLNHQSLVATESNRSIRKPDPSGYDFLPGDDPFSITDVVFIGDNAEDLTTEVIAFIEGRLELRAPTLTPTMSRLVQSEGACPEQSEGTELAKDLEHGSRTKDSKL
jgi:hypothetical protein